LLAKDETLLDQKWEFEKRVEDLFLRIEQLEKTVKEREKVIEGLEQFAEKVKKTPFYWFLKPKIKDERLS